MAYCSRSRPIPDHLERASVDLAERSVFGHPQHATCAELFRHVGWEYVSIDISNSTLHADLNFWQTGEYTDYFDFVANFGTTEHVFDQANCFRNIHRATKPGGFMIHFVPTTGYFYHCLFAYNPKLFLLLAKANNYRIVHAGLYTEKISKLDERHASWAQYQHTATFVLPSVLGEFVFQKQEDRDFQLCYDFRGDDPEIVHIFDPACTTVR
jgi:SAM-dependent methyltransferase